MNRPGFPETLSYDFVCFMLGRKVMNGVITQFKHATHSLYVVTPRVLSHVFGSTIENRVKREPLVLCFPFELFFSLAPFKESLPPVR